MSVSIELNAAEIAADLQQLGKDAEVAQQRAVRDTLRRLQTVGRREARRTTELKPASVNRRVRAYVRQGRLWFGAWSPVATSFTRARVRVGRGRGQQSRPLIVDGRLVPGVFVPQTGRWKGRSLIRKGGRIEAYRLDYSAEVKRAFDAVVDATEEVFDREFRATLERRQ